MIGQPNDRLLVVMNKISSGTTMSFRCKDLGGDLWFPRDVTANVERLKTLSGRPTDDTKNSKYYVGAVSRAWLWSNSK